MEGLGVRIESENSIIITEERTPKRRRLNKT